MRGFAGVLVVLVIGLLVYKFYFTSGQQAMGPGGPTQTIDTIGAKNDLVSMAQAERIYQAEHNSYGSLDDLVSSGALAIKKTRQGYTYEAENSTDSFRIVARCAEPVAPGCTNFAIDQTMEVSSTQ
jgi:3-hydroxyacyl-CoA dehydrogenase